MGRPTRASESAARRHRGSALHRIQFGRCGCPRPRSRSRHRPARRDPVENGRDTHANRCEGMSIDVRGAVLDAPHPISPNHPPCSLRRDSRTTRRLPLSGRIMGVRRKAWSPLRQRDLALRTPVQLLPIHLPFHAHGGRTPRALPRQGGPTQAPGGAPSRSSRRAQGPPMARDGPSSGQAARTKTSRRDDDASPAQVAQTGELGLWLERRCRAAERQGRGRAPRKQGPSGRDAPAARRGGAWPTAIDTPGASGSAARAPR